MRSFFKNFVILSICNLLIAVGYLSRSYLDTWLTKFYSAGFYEQFSMSAKLAISISVSGLAVACSILSVYLIVIVSYAILSELYYQFVKRNIIATFIRYLVQSASPAQKKKTLRSLHQEKARERRYKQSMESAIFRRREDDDSAKTTCLS